MSAVLASQMNKSASSSLNGGSPSNKSLNSVGQSASNGTLKPKHWSQKKHESCITSQCIEKSCFLSKLRGGSDSGKFTHLGLVHRQI